jgi:hypothetical protein
MKRSRNETWRSCALIAALLASFVAAHANADELLWDNGETDGSTLGMAETWTTMDDFVVPSGGWWIEHAETSGIYLGSEDVIDVQLAIWPHDYDEDEPDGDTAFMLDVTDWSAEATGNQYAGYDEIRVTADFDPVYLQSSKKYWLEFIVTDSFGLTRFIFLARQDVELQPAWLHFSGATLSPEDIDLAYTLSGTSIKLYSLFWAPGQLDLTIGSGVGVAKYLREPEGRAFQLWRAPGGPARVQMVATGRATVGEIGKLLLVIDSAVLRAPSVLQTIEIYNFKTQQWMPAHQAPVYSDAKMYAVEIVDGLAYVEPRTGQTMARLTWDYTGSDPSRKFGVAIDQINWVAYPRSDR